MLGGENIFQNALLPNLTAKNDQNRSQFNKQNVFFFCFVSRISLFITIIHCNT